MACVGSLALSTFAMFEKKSSNPSAELGILAQAMLNGSCHYLLGAMGIVALREAIGAYENDPDFLPFLAISLEAENLGLSKKTNGVSAPKEQPWQYTVAERKSVKWAKEISQTQCESLARRFGLV